MKKVISLLLALALSLALAVPALADGQSVFIMFPNDEFESTVGSKTGTGWSFDFDAFTLTLNGITDAKVILSHIGTDPTVVLAPGTTNTLTSFMMDSLSGEEGYPTVFKGSGELIISDPSATENGVLHGSSGSIKLQDGLTMTGGTKEGDSGKLTFKKFSGYPLYKLMAGDKPATYVRIGPAAGAKPAETQKPAASSTGFTDVAANSPYAEAIKWAVGKKITTGKTATTFGPGDPCTMGQANIFLWRNAGRPEPTNGYGNDMDMAEMWALNDAGYMDRLDDRSDTCTRLWFVYALWVVAGQPAASKTAAFTDVSDLNDDGRSAINWAVEKGVTTGKTADTFAPFDPCTRGQIVTFLYRAVK